jgi:hypothetical protein
MQNTFPISLEEAACRVVRQWRRFKLRSQFRRIVEQSTFLRRHQDQVKHLERKVEAARRLTLSDESVQALQLAAAQCIQRSWRRCLARRMRPALLAQQVAVQAATRIQRLWRKRRLCALLAKVKLSSDSGAFNPSSAVAECVRSFAKKATSEEPGVSTERLLQEYLSFRSTFPSQSAASTAFTESLLRRSASLRVALATPELLSVAVVLTGTTRKKEAAEFREFRLCGDSVKKVDAEALKQLSRLHALLTKP